MTLQPSISSDIVQPESPSPSPFFLSSSSANQEEALKVLFEERMKVFNEHKRGMYLLEQEKHLLETIPDYLNIAFLGYSGNGKSQLGENIDKVTGYLVERYEVQAPTTVGVGHGTLFLERRNVNCKGFNTYTYDTKGIGNLDAANKEVQALLNFVSREITSLGGQDAVVTSEPLKDASPWANRITFIYVVVSAVKKNEENLKALRHAIQLFKASNLPLIGVLTHTEMVEGKTTEDLLLQYQQELSLRKMFPVSFKKTAQGTLSMETQAQIALVLAETVKTFETHYVGKKIVKEKPLKAAFKTVKPYLIEGWELCRQIDKNIIIYVLIAVLAAVILFRKV